MATNFTELIPADTLATHVAKFLNLPDLLSLGSSCKTHQIGFQVPAVDKVLFLPHLDALLVGKSLTPRVIHLLAMINSYKLKIRFLIEDSRRDRIDIEELW
jgi:hypothetical protein